jgi:hypothetical protein
MDRGTVASTGHPRLASALAAAAVLSSVLSTPPASAAQPLSAPVSR